MAGRVTAAILRPFGAPDAINGLRLGFAYTTSETPEGLNSLRGQSIFGTANYFDRVYVKGRRQRYGAEASWTPGPLGFKYEWMQSREERDGQGNRDQDLSDFLGTGWYASGTWILTGENKSDEIEPDKPLFGGRHWARSRSASATRSSSSTAPGTRARRSTTRGPTI